jgi:hypothetical protein
LTQQLGVDRRRSADGFVKTQTFELFKFSEFLSQASHLFDAKFLDFDIDVGQGVDDFGLARRSGKFDAQL